MRSTLTLLAALSLLAFAVPAHAVTFGGEVYGMFNTHAMGDWNDNIDAANALGADIKNINNSFSGGLAARVWATPEWMFSLGWEPLFISTEDKAPGGIGKLKLTTQAILVTAAYYIPMQGPAKVGIGAGGGYYHLGGKIEESGFPDVDIKGNTVGFHVLALGEWTVSPSFGVAAAAGYRGAKISDTEIAGISTTPKTETDYSGFTGRLGVTFNMPTQ